MLLFVFLVRLSTVLSVEKQDAAAEDDDDADVLCREARCLCVPTVSCTMRDIVRTV